ncbi:MAG: adenosylmethionine--8-amino-7-oxononanoate transaminase, partial [Lentisphaeria bacterium]|nr:adenosylmethionine--8-amino-7-oxononanoate transaminase [Lentisphaeria bacterium]
MITPAMLAFDRDHLWHPYAETPLARESVGVEDAEGVRLRLSNGTVVVDAMSSWWCAIHGYRHPVLDTAMHEQIGRMSHVMFGGLTHAPAIELGKLLLDCAPEGLEKVFYADSGSVAVEVAMKMALQYWRGLGIGGRNRFLTIRGGYHGDTFGAMSVCDPVGGMHTLFSGVLPEHLFAPAPRISFHESWDAADAAEFAVLADQHAPELAAVILEPIVQGAGGMRFHHPQYLRAVRAVCDQLELPLILDEIATGFGRSGTLFACEHAGIVPDILCVGKVLTGGYMTLAATLATDRIAHAISRGTGPLMHGPTFMANPLACAVGRASVQMVMDMDL